MLTGDGSDEVLGGYRRHVAERYGWCFRSLPTLLLLAAPLARQRPGAADRFRQPAHQRFAGALCPLGWREQCFRRNPAEGARKLRQNKSPPFDADPRASSLRRALYFDQASWLPDNVLERGDRMTMAESLEMRAPYLDHKLVELVSALPDHCARARPGDQVDPAPGGAPLLAKLAPRKGGLRVPVAQWLRGELREYLLEICAGRAR